MWLTKTNKSKKQRCRFMIQTKKPRVLVEIPIAKEEK